MPIDDPYAVWCEIDKALGDFYGETWSGDNLSDLFVQRLTMLCALSLISTRQRVFVTLWRQHWTPAQIEQLTGQPEPDEARDRRLTQSEIARISYWSERLVRLELERARDALAVQIQEDPP